MLYVDKKKYVATYKEIVLVFITFSIVLFVLYPKDFLATQILNEKDNYDLSMLYLNNMLKNDPTNEVLMLTLAKQSIDTGKQDLSIKLLELLKNSKNKEIREETYMLSYKLLKDEYIYFEKIGDTKSLKEVYVKLKELMNIIVSTNVYKDKDIEGLYHEANYLNDTMNSFILVKKLLEITPNEVRLNKEAFYLSTMLSKEDDAKYYIDKLILLDKDNAQEWTQAKYYLLLDSSNYKESESFLNSQAENSPFWRKKLIGFYEFHKEYRSVVRVYMKSFKAEETINKKHYYLFKAVNTLRGAGYLDESIALAVKYEDYFLFHEELRVEFLKLYISANRLEEASRLSKKILQNKID